MKRVCAWIAAICLAGCGQDTTNKNSVCVEVMSTGLAATTQTVCLTYGIRSNTLSYVVIETWQMNEGHDKRVEGAIQIRPDKSNGGKQWLRMPGRGKPILLDESKAIYEYNGTRLVVAPLDISVEDLKAWISSYPEKYSIEAVRMFSYNRSHSKGQPEGADSHARIKSERGSPRGQPFE